MIPDCKYYSKSRSFCCFYFIIPGCSFFSGFRIAEILMDVSGILGKRHILWDFPTYMFKLFEILWILPRILIILFKFFFYFFYFGICQFVYFSSVVSYLGKWCLATISVLVVSNFLFSFIGWFSFFCFALLCLGRIVLEISHKLRFPLYVS